MKRFFRRQPRYVVLDGTQVAYTDVCPEREDTVLILHGIGTALIAGCLNEMVPEAFDPISEGRRALTFDWPGLGLSDPCPEEDVVPYFVKTLGRFMDETASDGASIVAFSMAGLVAARFAIENPRRVKKLVLVAPAGFQEVPEHYHAKAVEHWSADRLSGFSADELEAWYRSMTRSWSPALDEIVAMQKALMGDGKFLAFANSAEQSVRSSLRHPVLRQLPSLKTKTLVVWGAEDPIIPAQAAAVANLPNARLVKIEGAGHLVSAEKSSALAREVVSFLSEQGSTP